MKHSNSEGLRFSVENLATSLSCDGFREEAQAVLDSCGIGDIWTAKDPNLVEAYGLLVALESNCL